MAQTLEKLIYVRLLTTYTKKDIASPGIRYSTCSGGGEAVHHWGNVEMGPPDVIFGITEAFKKDINKNKVNLGVGAYRDENGMPWVLPCIRKAEERIHKKCVNHEYAPMTGLGDFTKAAAKLAFGDCSPLLQRKSNCTVQALSGTGALRLGLEFLTKYYARDKVIYLSAPTWGNHPQICNSIGLKHKKYRYFDPKTNGLDMKGFLEDICKIPNGSIILLHACAHNPTGVDPKPEQWAQLSQAIKEKKLYPFFDMAYQGFATGDVDNDARAIRMFVKDGHQVTVAQSFAKNMGLYGERIGALTFDCGNKETLAKVLSQIKIQIRTMYSNPPVYGARLVAEVLNTPELKKQWLIDVKKMANRIIEMRKTLRSGIEGAGNKRSWKHITDQIGMFCYTGLKPDEVKRITKDFHIYLTKDGRISLAGVSSKNVKYLAKAMHAVTSGCSSGSHGKGGDYGEKGGGGSY